MNILFIAPLPPPVTGQSLAAEVLLDELKKRHCIQAINFNKGTFKQGITSLSRIIQVCKLFKQIHRKNNDADVIYVTLSQSVAGNMKDLVTYAICFKKLGRMVIHLHGGGIKRIVFDRHPVLRWLNRLFLNRVGAAIVLGRSLEPIFSTMVSDDRIHTVPNFAQDELFLSREQIGAKFRSTDPLRILFLSNLIPRKGFQELAEAYNLLPFSLRAKVQIDFAGDFESGQQQTAFLDKIRNIQALYYHGVVRGHKKRQLLADAHILSLPTYYYYYEGQPIAILEAYASGCAVITTNHGGIPDIFEPGRNGFYVEKRSVNSIADAIRAILTKPRQLEQIAIYNNSLARNLYTKSQYLRSLINIIEQRPV